MLAPWRKNFKSRRYAHVKMMWGEASNRAALTGDLGAGPESMSTSEGRLFYVSAGKSAFNILGLFQQYRPKADIGQPLDDGCLSPFPALPACWLDPLRCLVLSLGVGNETARVCHADLWRSCVATCGARAAVCDARNRIDGRRGAEHRAGSVHLFLPACDYGYLA